MTKKRTRRREITEHPAEDGVIRFELLSWKHFSKLIARDILTYPGYVFRGQADAQWKLESSLDRLSRHLGKTPSASHRSLHLRRFKKAVRGRRDPSSKPIKDENEWWALGQHYGLATPLLDWTASPFVALYYAFLRANGGGRGRVVFALQAQLVEEYARKALKDDPKATVVRMYSPDSDDNPRLVSQGGLFSRIPDGEDLESWVKRAFNGSGPGVLLRIEIPDSDRDDCLTSLHRMNISHASLFPEIYGSAVFANTAYGISAYGGWLG